jgi:hypothetical protein
MKLPALFIFFSLMCFCRPLFIKVRKTGENVQTINKTDSANIQAAPTPTKFPPENREREGRVLPLLPLFLLPIVPAAVLITELIEHELSKTEEAVAVASVLPVFSQISRQAAIAAATATAIAN